MMNDFGGMGYGWVGIVLTLVFLALIVGGIVLVARGRGGSGGDRMPGPSPGAEYPPQSSARSAALAVLEERYARGEIDREEFMSRKTDLTG